MTCVITFLLAFFGLMVRRIIINPKGNEVNLVKHLSIYLGVDVTSKWPSGWSKYAYFSLTVVNQFDGKKSVSVPTTGICDIFYCLCSVFLCYGKGLLINIKS